MSGPPEQRTTVRSGTFSNGLAVELIVGGSPADADVAVCSTDEFGDIGPLNTMVLEAVGLSPRNLREVFRPPVTLLEAGKRKVLVVQTIESGAGSETLLRANLEQAFHRLTSPASQRPFQMMYLPLLATGHAGIPARDSAEASLHLLRSWSQPAVKQVLLAVPTVDMADQIVPVWERYFPWQAPIFTLDAIEPHARAAIEAAQYLSGDHEVAGGHVLRAVAALTHLRSAAFEEFRRLLPSTVMRAIASSVPSDAARHSLSLPLILEQQFKEQLTYARTLRSGRKKKSIWGRDLITAALLAGGLRDLPGLETTTADALIDAWYSFVVGDTVDPRPRADWDALWDAAGAPRPGRATAGETPARSGPHSTQLFQAFDPPAREVLAFAEALRVETRQRAVHMGHLFVALAREPDGDAGRFLKSRDYSYERLPTLFWGDSSRWSAPRLRELIPFPLSELPNVSDNVRSALSAAERAAQKRGSPSIGTADLFHGALSIDSPATSQLRSLSIRKEDVVVDGPVWRPERPGVASDTVAGQRDLLGLEREVEVLCSVIAARDVDPPVSIGLFGDWGTGKTFFMTQMQEWIDRMKKEARATPSGTPSAYCTNIVQLWFNAWHYIDTNLWASLTSSIFEGLGNALRDDDDLMKGVEDREKARARLLAEAANARDVLAEAEKKKIDAERGEQALQQSIDSLRSSEQEIASSLVNAAIDVARRQPEVKEKLEKAARTLGVPALEASTKELQSQVRQIGGVLGTLRALWMAMRQSSWRLPALVVLAALVTGVCVKLLMQPALQALISTGLLRIAGTLTFLTTLIVPYLRPAWRAKKLVDETLAAHGKALAEKADERRAELERQRLAVRKQMELAEQQLERARAAVGELDKELAALRADTRMSQFVAARRESTDYTQHLGVVARARRDFERLSDLLQQVRREGTSVDGVPLPRIDRIVLYIDDLDRCPEDKVFDVLQAVHLLLAFPLFVVVVGVDSRWLLHSLKERTGALRNVDSGGDGMSDEERIHWQSTPLNYLEKIFQIPFSLRPMERAGFERLVQHLVPLEPAAAHSDASKPTAAPPAPSEQVAPNGSPGPTLAGSPQTVPAPPVPSPAPAVSPPPSQSASRPLDLNPVHLKISPAEQDGMKQLFPFIPSPRATKRFVNVYRLLRATVDREKWDTFLDGHGGGHFRAVMLLLAVLTGYPSEGTEILRDLVEEPPAGTWWDALASYRARARAPEQLAISPGAAALAERSRWSELLGKLDEMRQIGLVGELEPCSVFSAWAPRVARYSFESARIQLARADGSSAATPRAGGSARPGIAFNGA